MSGGVPRLGGLLGRALDANLEGRLKRFVTGPESPAIAIFSDERADANVQGDWYGEHAGKWLWAASKAAARTGDATLEANVRRVADFLVARQRPDGYLGTYAPGCRFTSPPGAPQRTWDGAPARRTWDVWVHSYMVLGLLEAWRHFAEARWLEGARRIGELCCKVFVDGGADVTHLGNHHGMSATVLLDAAMELHFATGEARSLALALRVLEHADRRPELNLLGRALAGADAAEIGTGKAYQLAWNMVGLAKLHRATGDARHLEAPMKVWESIHRHHLTLGGGPWGGVAHRSREVFNAPGAFSPYGYVETCSTLAWIQLNRELLGATGHARHAEEIERSAYNDLLGAQAPHGEDWLYYSFPNGRRVFTTYWRCCKSSGAMALEELPDVAMRPAADGGVEVNLYGPARASIALRDGNVATLEQVTRYPFDGAVRLRVSPARPARFVLRLRVPSWATSARIAVRGEAAVEAPAGAYSLLDRVWRDGDEVELDFPMEVSVRRCSNRNVQESLAPDGTEVRQEVLRLDYVALTRGPLVYSTGLVDGYKVEETLRLGDSPRVEVIESPDEPARPLLVLHAQGRAPLTFSPYFEAGGREDGAWRLTWMQETGASP